MSPLLERRYLCYFALKGDSTWDLGATYIAISRLPWLTALAAWPTSGTWTRGAHFVAEAGRCDLGPPPMGPNSGEPPAEARHWQASADRLNGNDYHFQDVR